MSYFSFPRAYISGKYVVNTATANNSTATYDNVVYFDVGGVKLDLMGMTPAQFRDWFRQMNPDDYVNAIWDYYGDNSIAYENINITGVELEPNNLITNPASDAIIGGQVDLAGNKFGDVRTPAIMVDTDPVDAFTSQIFSDAFSVSQNGTALLDGSGNRKAYSYWLNYWRNLMEGGDNGCSAVWQIAIPKANLNLNTANSPFLQALNAGANAGQGIVIRYCTYLFEHIPYQEIADRFKAGNYDPTSARMIVVGTIGVWGNGELESVPLARILNPGIHMQLTSKDYTPTPPPVGVGKPTFFLGSTLVNVDTTRKVVTVDMVSTIPEIDSFDTMDPQKNQYDTPEKADLGMLQLVTLNPYPPSPGATQMTPIGRLNFTDYNKDAYLARAGLVDIPYDPTIESLILSGDLALQHGTGKAPFLLQENPYNIITDWRGVYLEGEDKGAIQVPIQVLYKGQPAPSGLMFFLSQSVNDDYPTTSEVLQPTTPEVLNPHSHTRLRLTTIVSEEDGTNIVNIPKSITTQTGGIAYLNISPNTAGLCKVWIQTPDDPDISKLNPDYGSFLQGETWYYVNVRVLPDDSALDNETKPNWAFMYDNFFCYYSLMYPAMNTHIDFDNEEQTTANATLIKNFVAERNENSTLYMPVTRELSAGKRRLVQRWASQHE